MPKASSQGSTRDINEYCMTVNMFCARLRLDALSCEQRFLSCLSRKQTNYATDKPNTNDFVNAKSHEKEKPLIAGY